MELDSFFENEELERNGNHATVVPRLPWHRVTLSPESPIFDLMQKVVEKIEHGKKSITVRVINKDKSRSLFMEVKETFKFVFDWQSADQCSVEAFKGEDSYEETARFGKKDWTD
jgi:hypothetical protein